MFIMVMNLITAFTKFLETPTRAHTHDYRFVHVDLSFRCRYINRMDRLFGFGTACWFALVNDREAR